jgi:GcrA cell cycle regulator
MAAVIGHGGSDSSAANGIRKDPKAMTRSWGNIRMPANAPTWTEERVELLKNGFEAGLSCREIAGEIGVSRNAVIGKLSRLNLTRDGSGEVRRTARTDATRGSRPRAAPRTGPRLQYQMLLAAYGETVSGEPVPGGGPIHSEHCCSLLELSEEKCRWPISTPGAADFCFCGNMPVEGLPYCAGHTRLAYRPGSRQRVARG